MATRTRPNGMADPVRTQRNSAADFQSDSYLDWCDRALAEMREPTIICKDAKGNWIEDPIPTPNGKKRWKTRPMRMIRDHEGNLVGEEPGIRPLTEEEVADFINRPNFFQHLWTFRKTNKNTVNATMSAFEVAREALHLKEFMYRLDEQAQETWGEHYVDRVEDEPFMDWIVDQWKADHSITRLSAPQSMGSVLQHLGESFDLVEPTTKENSGDARKWMMQNSRNTVPVTDDHDPQTHGEVAKKDSVSVLNVYLDSMGKATDEDELRQLASTAWNQLLLLAERDAITPDQARDLTIEIEEKVKTYLEAIRTTHEVEGRAKTRLIDIAAAAKASEALFD